MSGSLLTHCGADKIDEAAVATIVPPQRTKTWNPIPHKMLIEQVDTAASRLGLEATSRDFAISHEGHRLFGVICYKSEFSDMEMAVGLRNSTDKSMAAGVCLGNHVFVCDNMAFSSEVVMQKKHSSRIDEHLVDMVQGAYDQFIEAYHKDRLTYDRWKEVEVNEDQAAALLVRAAQRRALPGAGILKTFELFQEPPHPEYGRNTAWTLYNAATQFLTHERATLAFDGRQRELLNLHGLFADRFGAASLN